MSKYFSEKLHFAINKTSTEPETSYKLASSVFENALLTSNEQLKYECLSVMAYSSQFLGLYSESYSNAKNALDYFENTQNLFGVAFNLNTLGFIYNHFQNHEERLKVNLRSLEIRKQIKDTTGVCKSLNNTGDTYLKLGNPGKALMYFMEAEKYISEMGRTFKTVLSLNIAETYFYQDEYDLCLKYLDQSLKEAKVLGVKDIEYQCYKIYAKIEWSKNDFSKTKKLLKKAEEIVKGNDEFIPEQIEISKLLSTYHRETENFEKAYYYENLVNSITTVQMDLQHKKELNSIHVSYNLKDLESKKLELQSNIEEKTKELSATLNKLERQHAFNRKILNSTFLSIIVFDHQGRILKYNTPAKKLLNLTQNELIHKYISFQNDYDINKFLKQLFKIEKSNFVKFNFDMYSIDSDTKKFLNVNFISMEDMDEIVGIAFLEDITFKVESEKKRKEDLEVEIAINHFAQFLFNTNTIEEVVWGVAKNCISKLGFLDCVVYLIDEDKNCLIQRAAYGNKNINEYDILNPIEIQIGEGIVGEVAKTGEIELIDDTSADDRYLIDDQVRYSELAVPIKIDNKIIGVIDSEHPNKSFYTEKHTRILTTISKLVGNRIEKIQEQEEKEMLQKKITQINLNLENEVAQKTEENLILHRTVMDKEKQFFLGEMAALTSHEMNTPLANILNATSAILEINTKLGVKAQQLLLELEKGKIDLREFSQLHSRHIIKQRKDTLHSFFKTLQLTTSDELISFLSHFKIQKIESILFLKDLEVDIDTIQELSSFLKTQSFKEIVKSNTNTITQVVNELKSIKQLNESEHSNKFPLYNAIEKAFIQSQTLKKIRINELDKNCQLIAQESKIIQLFIDIFKLAEENIKLTSKSKVEIKSKEDNSNHIILGFKNILYDKDFFNKLEQRKNPLIINSITKIRLRIINSIIEAHNATIVPTLEDKSLFLTIKF